MKDRHQIPIVAAFRLAEYHCLLAELIKDGRREKITSKEIASRLSVSEEIVRKDLSFIRDDIGTPGLGYDPPKLYNAISKLLHLDKIHEIALIGNISTWRGISNFFDPRTYGFSLKYIFSDNPSEKGLFFDQISVYSIEDIPEVVKDSQVETAILACDHIWLKRAIQLLYQAGVKGILILTPTALEEVPPGMYVSQILLPCEIKLMLYHIHKELSALPSNKPNRDVGKRAKLKRVRTRKKS